ncbi:MAG: oligosaccharide flippase family protein [Clostridia bacterium]|nr:oligosaccharide flippase family protein [Clostridia bacterium]
MNILQKGKEKYIALSNPVKASIWFAICNILQKGISVITVPIFTRILTTEQYGIYSVYQSWYQIIAVFATLNLYYGVFNNGMLKYSKDKDGFTSAIQGLTTCITAVFLVVYIAGKSFWNNLLGLYDILIFAMFLELFFTPAYSFWAARQRYEFKYKKLVLITILIAVGSPILGIVAVLNTTYKAEARILSFVFVQVIVGMYFYIRNLKNGKKFLDLKYWKYALLFNLPLIPHYLSQSILNQVDRIMINSMEGPDKAAIYSVAYNISTLMVLVTSAINNSFIPYTYKKIKQKEYSDIKKNANILIMLVGICTFFVVAFGPEVIKIFAPSSYYEAIWVIPPVAVSVYFMFLYPLFGNVEFYFEENIFVMLASITGAIANLILNKIFIDMFGYLAAGYTTMVCYILFSAGHYIFMKKVIKKHIPDAKIYDIKFISIFSIIMIIGMILMIMSYNYVVIRYLIIFTMLLIVFIKREAFLKVLSNVFSKNKA